MELRVPMTTLVLAASSLLWDKGKERKIHTRTLDKHEIGGKKSGSKMTNIPAKTRIFLDMWEESESTLSKVMRGTNNTA